MKQMMYRSDLSGEVVADGEIVTIRVWGLHAPDRELLVEASRGEVVALFGKSGRVVPRRGRPAKAKR
jgi:hypothetical protein